MNKTVFAILLTLLLNLQLQSHIVADREWNFKSAADIKFVMTDTLAISIHFPDLIPDDRLMNYCHFHITISDSNDGPSVSGASLIYKFQFDAGFNNFNHVMTMEINDTSGLLKDRQCSPMRYGVYLDPYPVSKLHQWFAIQASQFIIDTTSHLIKITYNHTKSTSFLSLDKKFIAEQSKIASSGYPFNYGLFLADSGLKVRFYKKPDQMNVRRISDVSSGPSRIYNYNGRILSSVRYRTFSTSHFASGSFIIQQNHGNFSEKTKCTIVNTLK